MADWIRRSFGAPGLTQIPAGPHLRKLQRHFGGTVMLCIDVSGSMSGAPLAEAVRGARQFVAEAIAAHYGVGVILWDTGVAALAAPAFDGGAAIAVLDGARIRGGTDLLPALKRCQKIFDGVTGDRVVAVFGDGDLGPPRSRDAVLGLAARMKAQGIRFVTRGLGPGAAREFGEITSEDPGMAGIDDVADLAEGIASMAISLKSRTLRAPSTPAVYAAGTPLHRGQANPERFASLSHGRVRGCAYLL